MRDWIAAFLRAFASPPPPPPPARVERPAPVRSWQQELLAEADFTWEAAGGLLAAEEALQDAADARITDEALAALGPLAWVRPATELPREAFTRFGYEPGKRPTSLSALAALYDQVYGPCFVPLASRVVHDLALYGALESWTNKTPDVAGARLHVVFRQLSAHLSEALAFTAAPLGRVDKHRTLGGFYDESEQKIFLATSLLNAHPASVVNTIAHEQAHRLQHLLIQRLRYAPRKLSAAERSLALYWFEEGTAAPGVDYAKYRYNGREYHADAMGKTVVKALMPVFGWGAETLRY